MTDDGLVKIKSPHGVKESADRAASAIGKRGLTIFSRVDHGAGAEAVGLSLRPTELLIFGNAKGGTPLMQAEQSAGIDLPLKLLIFEDAGGTVWLAYNDPRWIAARHGITGAGESVEAIARVLSAVTKDVLDRGE